MSEAQVLVGRYRLIRELGAGAMGTVWLAQDTTLKRQVAVKRVTDPLTPQLGRQAEMARLRAMREGRVAARLSHPNAVGIYDVAIHEGEPWLVMEYVPSRTLTDIVHTHGPIPPQRAALLGTQIASALAEAHRVGIVHRDVKPSNLLLTEEGEAKLTDFGIARSGGDATLTASGLVTGTPAYFAPELARGADPTPSSDVWSLGATLYFAVEGTPPFGNDDNPLVLLGRVANQPVPPPTRAGELARTIMRLLDREPVRRPTMVESRSMLAALSKGTETIPLTLLQEELGSEQDDDASTSTREFPEVQGADAFSVAPAASELGHEGSSHDGEDLPGPSDDPHVAAEPAGADEAATTAGSALAEAGLSDEHPADAAGVEHGTVAGNTSSCETIDLETYDRTSADADSDEQDGVADLGGVAAGTLAHGSDTGYAVVGADGETDTDTPDAAAPAALRVPPGRSSRRRTRVLLALVVAVVGVLGSYLVATAVTPPDGEPQADNRQSGTGDDASKARQNANNNGTRDDRDSDESNDKQSQTPTSTPDSEKGNKNAKKEKADQPRVRMTASQMTRAVSQYYDQLPSDTGASWRMLSPAMQSMGRSDYDGWWGLVSSVKISDLEPNPGNATVTGRVSYRMNDGGSESERRRLGLVISEDGKRLLIQTDSRL